VAVSPIVGGSALRGPADRMLDTLDGREPSAAAFVAHYRERHPGLVGTYVIDERDAALGEPIMAAGPEPILVLDTVMSDRAGRERLAGELLARTLPGA
jgi:LPPG:FO 2-phospho-L-lactate transferase